MYRIKVYNKISEEGLGLFGENRYRVGDGEKDPDAILVRSKQIGEEEIHAGLRCIARAGTGVNNIPVKTCSERGVVVMNTPGANANAVKELTLCGLLMASRNIPDALNFISSLQGDQVVEKVEAEKSRFMGWEIEGKTLGVIGLGNIGRMVANAAVALGMEVLGYDPYLSPDSASRLSSRINTTNTAEDIYRKAHCITLHVPLTSQTRGFIGQEQLAQMRTGVVLLNFSRGELVRDDHLLSALAEGRVGQYVTDFPNHALLRVKNVLCIPHLGASTPESEVNCAVMAAKQVKDFLECGNILHSVNFPDCYLEPSTGIRIAVACRNAPGMSDQIMKMLADENLEIRQMASQTRGDLAYLIMDLEFCQANGIFKKIRSINNVLSARMWSNQ